MTDFITEDGDEKWLVLNHRAAAQEGSGAGVHVGSAGGGTAGQRAVAEMQTKFRCAAQRPKVTYVDRGASHVLLCGGCSLSAFRAPSLGGGMTEGRPWCPPGRPMMGSPAESRSLEPDHLTFPLPLPCPALPSFPLHFPFSPPLPSLPSPPFPLFSSRPLPLYP